LRSNKRASDECDNSKVEVRENRQIYRRESAPACPERSEGRAAARERFKGAGELGCDPINPEMSKRWLQHWRTIERG
jgi:hypothetical protein